MLRDGTVEQCIVGLGCLAGLDRAEAWPAWGSCSSRLGLTPGTLAAVPSAPAGARLALGRLRGLACWGASAVPQATQGGLLGVGLQALARLCAPDLPLSSYMMWHSQWRAELACLPPTDAHDLAAWTLTWQQASLKGTCEQAGVHGVQVVHLSEVGGH